jgi:hypothetical protein
MSLWRLNVLSRLSQPTTSHALLSCLNIISKEWDDKGECQSTRASRQERRLSSELDVELNADDESSSSYLPQATLSHNRNAKPKGHVVSAASEGLSTSSQRRDPTALQAWDVALRLFSQSIVAAPLGDSSACSGGTVRPCVDHYNILLSLAARARRWDVMSAIEEHLVSQQEVVDENDHDDDVDNVDQTASSSSLSSLRIHPRYAVSRLSAEELNEVSSPMPKTAPTSSDYEKMNGDVMHDEDALSLAMDWGSNRASASHQHGAVGRRRHRAAPNETTFQILMAASLQVGDWENALDLFADLREEYIPISSSTVGLAIMAHRAAGNLAAHWQPALRTFLSLRHRVSGGDVLRHVLTLLRDAGRPAELLDVYHDSRRVLMVDEATLAIVSDACRATGRWELAAKICVSLIQEQLLDASVVSHCASCAVLAAQHSPQRTLALYIAARNSGTGTAADPLIPNTRLSALTSFAPAFVASRGSGQLSLSHKALVAVARAARLLGLPRVAEEIVFSGQSPPEEGGVAVFYDHALQAAEAALRASPPTSFEQSIADQQRLLGAALAAPVALGGLHPIHDVLHFQLRQCSSSWRAALTAYARVKGPDSLCVLLLVDALQRERRWEHALALFAADCLAPPRSRDAVSSVLPCGGWTLLAVDKLLSSCPPLVRAAAAHYALLSVANSRKWDPKLLWRHMTEAATDLLGTSSKKATSPATSVSSDMSSGSSLMPVARIVKAIASATFFRQPTPPVAPAEAPLQEIAFLPWLEEEKKSDSNTSVTSMGGFPGLMSAFSEKENLAAAARTETPQNLLPSAATLLFALQQLHNPLQAAAALSFVSMMCQHRHRLLLLYGRRQPGDSSVWWTNVEECVSLLSAAAEILRVATSNGKKFTIDIPSSVLATIASIFESIAAAPAPTTLVGSEESAGDDGPVEKRFIKSSLIAKVLHVAVALLQVSSSLTQQSTADTTLGLLEMAQQHFDQDSDRIKEELIMSCIRWASTADPVNRSALLRTLRLRAALVRAMKDNGSDESPGVELNIPEMIRILMCLVADAPRDGMFDAWSWLAVHGIFRDVIKAVTAPLRLGYHPQISVFSSLAKVLHRLYYDLFLVTVHHRNDDSVREARGDVLRIGMELAAALRRTSVKSRPSDAEKEDLFEQTLNKLLSAVDSMLLFMEVHHWRCSERSGVALALKEYLMLRVAADRPVVTDHIERWIKASCKALQRTPKPPTQTISSVDNSDDDDDDDVFALSLIQDGMMDLLLYVETHVPKSAWSLISAMLGALSNHVISLLGKEDFLPQTKKKKIQKSFSRFVHLLSDEHGTRGLKELVLVRVAACLGDLEDPFMRNYSARVGRAVPPLSPAAIAAWCTDAIAARTAMDLLDHITNEAYRTIIMSAVITAADAHLLSLSLQKLLAASANISPPAVGVQQDEAAVMCLMAQVVARCSLLSLSSMQQAEALCEDVKSVFRLSIRWKVLQRQAQIDKAAAQREAASARNSFDAEALALLKEVVLPALFRAAATDTTLAANCAEEQAVDPASKLQALLASVGDSGLIRAAAAKFGSSWVKKSLDYALYKELGCAARKIVVAAVLFGVSDKHPSSDGSLQRQHPSSAVLADLLFISSCVSCPPCEGRMSEEIAAFIERVVSANELCGGLLGVALAGALTVVAVMTQVVVEHTPSYGSRELVALLKIRALEAAIYGILTHDHLHCVPRSSTDLDLAKSPIVGSLMSSVNQWIVENALLSVPNESDQEDRNEELIRSIVQRFSLLCVYFGKFSEMQWMLSVIVPWAARNDYLSRPTRVWVAMLVFPYLASLLRNNCVLPMAAQSASSSSLSSPLTLITRCCELSKDSFFPGLTSTRSEERHITGQERGGVSCQLAASHDVDGDGFGSFVGSFVRRLLLSLSNAATQFQVMYGRADFVTMCGRVNPLRVLSAEACFIMTVTHYRCGARRSAADNNLARNVAGFGADVNLHGCPVLLSNGGFCVPLRLKRQRAFPRVLSSSAGIVRVPRGDDGIRQSRASMFGSRRSTNTSEQENVHIIEKWDQDVVTAASFTPAAASSGSWLAALAVLQRRDRVLERPAHLEMKRLLDGAAQRGEWLRAFHLLSASLCLGFHHSTSFVSPQVSEMVFSNVPESAVEPALLLLERSLASVRHSTRVQQLMGFCLLCSARLRSSSSSCGLSWELALRVFHSSTAKCDLQDPRSLLPQRNMQEVLRHCVFHAHWAKALYAVYRSLPYETTQGPHAFLSMLRCAKHFCDAVFAKQILHDFLSAYDKDRASFSRPGVKLLWAAYRKCRGCLPVDVRALAQEMRSRGLLDVMDEAELDRGAERAKRTAGKKKINNNNMI